MSVKILLADDHRMFRDGLRALLAARPDLEVVGEAEDGAGALTAIGELHPDAVLLDVQLPDMDGFAVIEAIVRLNGHAPKVVLTSSHDASDFGSIVPRCGAAAFVPKAELSGAALRAVLR